MREFALRTGALEVLIEEIDDYGVVEEPQHPGVNSHSDTIQTFPADEFNVGG